MNNKYSIKNRSIWSAVGTISFVPFKASAAAIELLADKVENHGDKILTVVDKGIDSGIDAIEIGIDAVETATIELQLNYEDWCQEKGVKPFSTKEEKLAALRAARASQKEEEKKEKKN